ncbi:sensor histidine kinase [Martelella radicis]|uniref:histidine kinase n=1 Tax=Martelella radicis TaxID=1397476 RepID=A0A7W6KIF2_9HYPH|nr:ATP-binding protein [Martelella radicis]MBB4121876.1 signal transduction histidine kinase [Martelella radicis]
MRRILQRFSGKVVRPPTALEWRVMLALFAGAFCVVLLIWYVSHSVEQRLQAQRERLRSEAALRLADIWVSGFIADYAQYLHVIKDSYAFQGRLAGQVQADALLQDFDAWVRAKPDIAQLRYIASDGMEQIRIDRIGGAVVPVARPDLQDKSERYYFEAANRLPDGALYLSPLDLNVEEGVIEEPWKPVLRLATPVFAAEDDRRGVLIINIDASSLLVKLDLLASPLARRIQLLNVDGYWMGGVPSRDRWGFMFGNNDTLAAREPRLWAEMTAGTTYSEKGQEFVFDRMPIGEAVEDEAGFDHVETADTPWYLLINYPRAAPFLSADNIPGFIVLFAGSAAFAAVGARLVAYRRAAEERVQAVERRMVRVDRLAGLGGLVAGVSHELNTPIGNAMMVATTIDRRAEGLQQALEEGRIGRNALAKALDDIRQGTEMTREALEGASEIIRNFKQIAVDQASDRRRRFALDNYLRDTIALLQPQFSKGNVSLLAGTMVEVRLHSYPGPLGQAVSNLVINARLHAFPDGAPGTVTVSAAQPDRRNVAITIADDGCGIAPEDRDRIFDPFFSTSFGKGGSGLGLVIVHNIVTGMLGGDVAVDSAPGAGTRITLVFPIVSPLSGAEENAYQMKEHGP